MIQIDTYVFGFRRWRVLNSLGLRGTRCGCRRIGRHEGRSPVCHRHGELGKQNANEPSGQVTSRVGVASIDQSFLPRSLAGSVPGPETYRPCYRTPSILPLLSFDSAQ